IRDATVTGVQTCALPISYTVAAIGATPTSLALEVFVDNNSLAPGAAKLRVYHLSPNLGPLNVDSGGNTIVQGVTYQQASNYHSRSEERRVGKQRRARSRL